MKLHLCYFLQRNFANFSRFLPTTSGISQQIKESYAIPIAKMISQKITIRKNEAAHYLPYFFEENRQFMPV